MSDWEIIDPPEPRDRLTEAALDSVASARATRNSRAIRQQKQQQPALFYAGYQSGRPMVQDAGGNLYPASATITNGAIPIGQAVTGLQAGRSLHVNQRPRVVEPISTPTEPPLLTWDSGSHRAQAIVPGGPGTTQLYEGGTLPAVISTSGRSGKLRFDFVSNLDLAVAGFGEDYKSHQSSVAVGFLDAPQPMRMRFEGTGRVYDWGKAPQLIVFAAPVSSTVNANLLRLTRATQVFQALIESPLPYIPYDDAFGAFIEVPTRLAIATVDFAYAFATNRTAAPTESEPFSLFDLEFGFVDGAETYTQEPDYYYKLLPADPFELTFPAAGKYLIFVCAEAAYSGESIDTIFDERNAECYFELSYKLSNVYG